MGRSYSKIVLNSICERTFQYSDFLKDTEAIGWILSSVHQSRRNKAAHSLMNVRICWISSFWMKVGIHEVNEKWLLHFAVTNCFLDQKKKMWMWMWIYFWLAIQTRTGCGGRREDVIWVCFHLITFMVFFSEIKFKNCILVDLHGWIVLLLWPISRYLAVCPW